MSRPFSTAWRMGVALVLLPLLIVILLLGSALADPPSGPLHSREAPAASLPIATHWPPLDWWDWGINRSITAPERLALLSTNCQAIYSLGGALSRVSGVITWIPQGRLRDVPAGFPTHLVVRIDADIGRSLDDGNTELMVDLLVSGYQRNRTPATIGLQLDCDVPTKRLASYARLLHALRQRLPVPSRLSVTMLLDWTHNRAGLSAIGNEVDWVVPQFYSALTPLSPSAVDVSFAGDWNKTIQRLEKSSVPYLLGLPTFMQCSVFSASGDLLHPSIPLSPAAALAAGGSVVRVVQQDEITVEIVFPTQLQLAGETLPAGSHALFGQLSASGLGHLLGQLRRLAPPHCLAVCLFHLPGIETTQSLSISQVAAADKGVVHPATISARLEPQHDGLWTVIIRNPGDEDWLDLASPARVILSAHGQPISISKDRVANPAVVRITTAGTAEDNPSPASDTWNIDIGLLHAAEVLTIEDIKVPVGTTPVAVVVNAARQPGSTSTTH